MSFSIRLSLNGEGGIRTHAPFRTNGFQDRLVMTASIPLQTCFSILHHLFLFVKHFFIFFQDLEFFLWPSFSLVLYAIDALIKQLSYFIIKISACQPFFSYFHKFFHCFAAVLGVAELMFSLVSKGERGLSQDHPSLLWLASRLPSPFAQSNIHQLYFLCHW